MKVSSKCTTMFSFVHLKDKLPNFWKINESTFSQPILYWNEYFDYNCKNKVLWLDHFEKVNKKIWVWIWDSQYFSIFFFCKKKLIKLDIEHNIIYIYIYLYIYLINSYK